MRSVKAIKKQEQKMLEVTGYELLELLKERPSISIGDYDKNNTLFETHKVIGYVAGEIDKLDSTELIDLWFINKDFFDKNYQEL